MPETATSTPTSPSTGTRPTSTEPAVQPVAPLRVPTRLAVRHKQVEAFTAYQLTKPERFKLFSGETLYAKAGEWAIGREGYILDVLDDSAFHHQFEVIDASDLSVPGPIRTELDSALGFGSTATPEALLTAVRRLVRLTIGEIEIPFTPAQWEDLSHRAKKRGLTVDQLMRQLVAHITTELWNNAAGA